MIISVDAVARVASMNMATKSKAALAQYVPLENLISQSFLLFMAEMLPVMLANLY